MIEEVAADELEEDFEDGEPEADEIEVEGETTDNVGDPSVEINVEELIHELEADGFIDQLDREKNTRRRLEELMERKRAVRELEDFEDYEI
jgi:hypothetical protein